MSTPSSATTASSRRLQAISRVLISLNVGNIVKISTGNSNLPNAGGGSVAGKGGIQTADSVKNGKDGKSVTGNTNPRSSDNDPISSDQIKDIKASLESIIISREFASLTADRKSSVVSSTPFLSSPLPPSTSATAVINDLPTATTVGPSLTPLPTRNTLESSPIIVLTQAPVETVIVTSAQASSKSRVDRRTTVGLSVVLGLISVAVMAYVGFLVFRKLRSRMTTSHTASQATIEVYKETSTSSSGISSLITPQRIQSPSQARTKRAMFLSERSSAHDVEAGRALVGRNPAGGSRREPSPLTQTSTRASVLSDGSDDGSLASLPSYHSRT